MPGQSLLLVATSTPGERFSYQYVYLNELPSPTDEVGAKVREICYEGHLCEAKREAGTPGQTIYNEEKWRAIKAAERPVSR